MRVLILVIAVVSLILTGCQVVSGSGNVVIEERQVVGFDGVALSGMGELTVIQADKTSVVIEAEDNILPFIETEVHQGVLHIGIKDGVAIRNSKPLKYTVTTPSISLLDVSGAGSISSEQIEADKLAIDVSGSGEIMLADITAVSLAVVISGNGEVLAQGEVDDQSITISGSGNYAAPNLVSNNAEVNVSGAGDALVWATDTLSVDISGSGKVAYQGEPQVNHSISGAGAVQQVAER